MASYPEFKAAFLLMFQENNVSARCVAVSKDGGERRIVRVDVHNSEESKLNALREAFDLPAPLVRKLLPWLRYTWSVRCFTDVPDFDAPPDHYTMQGRYHDPPR